MSPDQILGLAAFLAGLGVGFLVQWALFERDRRDNIHRRMQQPPFTTEGQGRG